jgi:eukaryotic-like serine/threonine-protein kinase
VHAAREGGVIGHQLGSRYELRRMLGRGGMGQVYEAWDTRLGQRVAVKLLHDRVGGDPALVARLTRDARAVAGAGHPNIVAIREIGRDGERHFMVMELVEGRSVAELLRAGPLAAEQAAAIAADVCLALEHTHRRGFAHLGLKPTNILVTSGGEAKVTDFGLGQVGVAPGRAGGNTFSETAEYLAPEQAAGGYVDGRADFYALGVCLYEMLTGRPPFGRAGEPHGDGTLTGLTIASRHLRDAPVPPHQLQPGVPAALDRVVLRALAKQPDARHQSAEEFLRELDRFSRRTTMAPPGTGHGIDGGVPAGGVEAAGSATARGTTGSAAIVLWRPAPVRPAASIPAPSGVPPVATAGGAHAAPARLLSADEPRALDAVSHEAEAPARRRRLTPARRRARRGYAWVAGLAALLLAVGGTVSALSGSSTSEGRNDTALRPQPGPQSSIPPTTLAARNATGSSTTATTATTATTTAPSTTGLVTTTSAAGLPAMVAVLEVVGDDLDEAAAKLARQGLRTRVQAVPVRARPHDGEVLDQDPPAGTQVARGTTVTLTVGRRSDRADQG